MSRNFLDKDSRFMYNSLCRLKERQNGSIAQLGEHLPYKQRVTGSSPVTPTILAR